MGKPAVLLLNLHVNLRRDCHREMYTMYAHFVSKTLMPKGQDGGEQFRLMRFFSNI